MSAAAQAPAQVSATPPQLAVAYSVCRHIARSSAKNFYYAFLVLPRHKRQALCAVYAFMRRCDDIADDVSVPVGERRNRLAMALDALHRAQAGEPCDDAVLLALTDTQRRYNIASELLDELAYGTMMDVQEDGDRPVGQEPRTEMSAPQELRVPYRTFDDLYQYCYRVASVVGLVCIRVFGYRDPAAEALAEKCGLAFQLTNIIRDVKEDAQMGRVYLPEQDMAAFGISASELLGTGDTARIRPLLSLEAQRAREFYLAGDELIPLVEEDSQPALWVLINIYRALLEKITQRQCDVFQGRISLSVREKLTILGKGFLKRLA
jgi:15-cis-phytoene synthase